MEARPAGPVGGQQDRSSRKAQIWSLTSTLNGEKETQPRGNCRETSAGGSAEVKGQHLR